MASYPVVTLGYAGREDRLMGGMGLMGGVVACGGQLGLMGLWTYGRGGGAGAETTKGTLVHLAFS